MHERGLHVDGEDDAEPDQIDAELLRSRPEQGNDDEGQLEEVEEERQHEYQRVHEQQEADLTARQRREQMLDPDVPAHTVKRE